MGIPSYFSHIVKNHRDIIQKFQSYSLKVDNLYLDSNSIVYDVVHKDPMLTEADIIQHTVLKIDSYIALIKPRNNIFIAFDGVAPVAKMDQQRQRRHRNTSLSEGFDTTKITPGTDFMKRLNAAITKHYANQPNVIVSFGVGEGEHKLFQFIRDNKEDHKNQTTVIYGLDADLIMLSLNHLEICPKIYLFRETPHFVQSIDRGMDPNENYLMDIGELARTMNIEIISMNDYIFLCFFLGNDFMPHFPAISIRTGGVDKMLNVYKKDEPLIVNSLINWRNVRSLVQRLADQEEEFIIAETKLLVKREGYKSNDGKHKDKDKEKEKEPELSREVERYINPEGDGWQQRYYKTLFDLEIDDVRRKQICLNYLEGLEWTFKYYTSGCPDWRWSYKYNYPPLLQDLVKYVPYFDIEFILPNDNKPVTELTQLQYVLPPRARYLLPKDLQDTVVSDVASHLITAYCRYDWEGHIQLPEIELV